MSFRASLVSILALALFSAAIFLTLFLDQTASFVLSRLSGLEIRLHESQLTSMDRLSFQYITVYQKDKILLTAKSGELHWKRTGKRRRIYFDFKNVFWKNTSTLLGKISSWTDRAVPSDSVIDRLRGQIAPYRAGKMIRLSEVYFGPVKIRGSFARSEGRTRNAYFFARAPVDLARVWVPKPVFSRLFYFNVDNSAAIRITYFKNKLRLYGRSAPIIEAQWSFSN